MFFNREMAKQTVVYPQYVVLLHNEKEKILKLTKWMDLKGIMLSGKIKSKNVEKMFYE